MITSTWKRKLEVHEVFELLRKTKSKKEKVKILQDNNSGALQDICRGVFDHRIVWKLPNESDPPYNPSTASSVPASLLKETAKLAFFVQGGRGANLSQVRREQMFIQLLEGIHPEDAKIILKTIKKQPPDGLTEASVREAFPNLLPD